MDDLGFVQKCLANDPLAWSEFISRYSRLIYSYIYGILKQRGIDFSQPYAEDIFQEFFLHLRKNNFRKLRSFKAKNNCSLAGWLKVVLVHFAIDYLRKERELVSLETEIDENLTLKDTLKDEKPLSRDKVLALEKIQQLKDCVALLEHADKYFLELHISRGIELEDLKEVLRLSRPAVDMRKYRIIERLRECFKQKGFVLD